MKTAAKPKLKWLREGHDPHEDLYLIPVGQERTEDDDLNTDALIGWNSGAAADIINRRIAYLRSLGEDVRNTVAWRDAVAESRRDAVRAHATSSPVAHRGPRHGRRGVRRPCGLDLLRAWTQTQGAARP
jgi:hypothetical protein